jgi:alpha-L-fucosidase 2
VDLDWSAAGGVNAVLAADPDTTVAVRCGDQRQQVPLAAGVSYTWRIAG